MTSNLDSAHFNMLVQQVRPSDVLSPRVLNAMQEIDREKFVSPELSGLAYADTELPIGWGQVMLSPVLEGRFLQILDIQAQEKVLEIGTGNGYFTALLAKLAASVISVEIVPELTEIAQKNLQQAGIDNVTLMTGDAARGWPLDDRIDVIVATAAFTTVPDAYLHSLEVGGRMLAVVGKAPVMSVQIIRRVTEWEWRTETVLETVIPAMINAEPKPEFEF